MKVVSYLLIAAGILMGFYFLSVWNEWSYREGGTRRRMQNLELRIAQAKSEDEDARVELEKNSVLLRRAQAEVPVFEGKSRQALWLALYAGVGSILLGIAISFAHQARMNSRQLKRKAGTAG